MDNKKRCAWCNPKNPLYIAYHDSEWCVPNFDDQYLYEMLLLESFQAGLSWECVLNKRESFRKTSVILTTRNTRIAERETVKSNREAMLWDGLTDKHQLTRMQKGNAFCI